MNQILYTGDAKNRKSPNIKSIIKFFAISLAVFGICIIGVAIYSILNSKDKANLKPEIQIVPSIEDKLISVKITDDLGIDKIVYKLNDQETELELNGKLEKSLELDLDEGENVFKITVTDIKGEQKEFEQLYTVENKTNVEFSSQSGKINVKITSENEISYITYRWDDGEETKVEIGDKKYDLIVDSPEGYGKYTLTVNVVDINNATTEATKEVIKDKEPTVQVSRNDKEFIIHAEDDEGLNKVQLILNGNEVGNIEINEKTWDYTVPFVEGENKLIIRVYNINEVYKERKVRVNFTKE